MDKSDRILSAIDQLAKNVSGQIESVRAEVRAVDAKLSAQIAAVDAKLSAKIADVDAKLSAKIADVEATLAAMAVDVAVLKGGQTLILQHLDVAELKGRVEEQSRTIASLIPTRVAAVGGRQ